MPEQRSREIGWGGSDRLMRTADVLLEIRRTVTANKVKAALNDVRCFNLFSLDVVQKSGTVQQRGIQAGGHGAAVIFSKTTIGCLIVLPLRIVRRIHSVQQRYIRAHSSSTGISNWVFPTAVLVLTSQVVAQVSRVKKLDKIQSPPEPLPWQVLPAYGLPCLTMPSAQSDHRAIDK